jgi:hypothetical protein
MNNKIVFYVRALFHESIMPGNEKLNRPDILKLTETFKKYSNISAEDYRKELHNIQLKSLYKISDRIIYNKAKLPTSKTFREVQENTINQLKQLNDDDWIIPIDDDDWFSPDIRNLEFKKECLNYWNTISFTQSDPINIFKHHKNKELPYTNLTEEDEKLSKSLLSNCQCIPAYVIKYLIKINATEVFSLLLQRHSFVRGLIREEPASQLNLKENIFDNVMSVYVKHAANITTFMRLFKFGQEEAYTKEVYDEVVAPFKNADYDNILNLPEYLNWTKPLLQEFKKLNQLL